MTPFVFFFNQLQWILTIFRLSSFFILKLNRILFFYAISASYPLKNIFKKQSHHILFFYVISASYPLKMFFKTLKSIQPINRNFYLNYMILISLGYVGKRLCLSKSTNNKNIFLSFHSSLSSILHLGIYLQVINLAQDK